MNMDEAPINVGESPIDYPIVRLDIGPVKLNKPAYEGFIECLRNILRSGSSHGIDVLRKLSEINKWNKFVEVELFYVEFATDRKVSITLALYVLNANVIAYKSENNSFFFENAPRDAKCLLFDGTRKYDVYVSTDNYKYLPDRSKIVLSGDSLRGSVGILHDFHGRKIDTAFLSSLVVVMQMVTEAIRFKFIEKYISSHLFDGYTPGCDTISFEDKWIPLSKEIELSGLDGKFRNPVQVKNADCSIKIISCVDEVKPYIAMLLYVVGSRETEEMSTVDHASADDDDEEQVAIVDSDE